MPAVSDANASPGVAIVTGASQGTGAGVAEGFRGAGYAVVATSRSISPSEAADILTVRGDITEAETAQTIVEQAVNRIRHRAPSCTAKGQRSDRCGPSGYGRPKDLLDGGVEGGVELVVGLAHAEPL